jgi:hypothetical protein
MRSPGGMPCGPPGITPSRRSWKPLSTPAGARHGGKERGGERWVEWWQGRAAKDGAVPERGGSLRQHTMHTQRRTQKPPLDAHLAAR